MKPCDKCQKNIAEYIENGEVTCYLTCQKWLEWSGQISNIPE